MRVLNQKGSCKTGSEYESEIQEEERPRCENLRACGEGLVVSGVGVVLEVRNKQ